MGFKAGAKPLLEGDYGPLTDAGVAKVIEHLTKHKGTAACPACYSDEWTIDRYLLFLRTYNDNTKGRVFVSVNCDGCGHARLFDSHETGVRAGKGS